LCGPAPTTPAPADAPTTIPGPAAGGTAFRVQEGSPEEARLLALVEASKEQRRRLDAQMAGSSAALVALQSELAAAESQLAASEGQARDLRARLDERSRQLDQAADELRRLAVASYVHGAAAVNRVAAMLSAGRPTSELELAADYARAVAVNRAAAVRRLRAARSDLEVVSRGLTETVTATAAQRDRAAVKAAAVADAASGLSQLRDQLSAVVSRQEELVGQVLASRDEFEARYKVLAEESETIAARLRGTSPDVFTGPSLGPNAGFLWPVPHAVVTSPFGPRLHPVFGTTRMHTGVDLGAGAGTPILAAADGVVVTTGQLGGYGNVSVVAHGGSVATLYAHQSTVLVSEGQTVTRGQVIGEVGCTGVCTGPHLHFEVRVDGQPVDPATWVSPT
jgi:murein DD-endopeptidase MepM/ murein hydrolase activator NlpD